MSKESEPFKAFEGMAGMLGLALLAYGCSKERTTDKKRINYGLPPVVGDDYVKVTLKKYGTMTNEFDQSTESRFWQSKALEVAEEIDEQWKLIMSTLRSKPNTYLISENYYNMVREIKQVIMKYE